MLSQLCVSFRSFAFCQVFVAGELENVGQRVALAAVLRGGYTTVPSTLINGHGLGVKYCSALSSRRKIWMTDEFAS